MKRNFLKAALLLLCMFGFAAQQHAFATGHAGIWIRDTVPAGRLDSTRFTKVEVEADFPGGLSGWRTFLEQNMRGEVPADNGAPAGQYTVVVQFIVDTDGSLSDITALSRNGYGMEAEVIRLIRMSPKWNPATIGNWPVKAYRKQPVIFVIEEEKKKRRRG